jgi:hypothetical protein
MGFLLCVSLGLGGWGWYSFARTNDRLRTAEGRVGRLQAADAARQRAAAAAAAAADRRAAEVVSIPVDVTMIGRCRSEHGSGDGEGDGGAGSDTNVQVTLSRTDGTEIGTATISTATSSFIWCDLSGSMSVRRGDLGADRYLVHSNGDDVTISRATLLSQGIRLTID